MESPPRTTPWPLVLVVPMLAFSIRHIEVLAGVGLIASIAAGVLLGLTLLSGLALALWDDWTGRPPSPIPMEPPKPAKGPRQFSLMQMFFWMVVGALAWWAVSVAIPRPYDAAIVLAFAVLTVLYWFSGAFVLFAGMVVDRLRHPLGKSSEDKPSQPPSSSPPGI